MTTGNVHPPPRKFKGRKILPVKSLFWSFAEANATQQAQLVENFDEMKRTVELRGLDTIGLKCL